MKIYLCGPINGCSDSECNSWRDEARLHFSDTLDPMRRDYRGREGDCVNEIVELDKKDVDDCDIVLANCPKPSYGTSMEIMYAYMTGKSVVSVVPDLAKTSPWLIYHSTVVIESLEDAFKSIEALEWL